MSDDANRRVDRAMTTNVIGLREYFRHSKTGVVHVAHCNLLRTVPAGRLRPVDLFELEACARLCRLCTQLDLPARQPPRRVGELSAHRRRFVRCRELAAKLLEQLKLCGIPAEKLSAFVAQIAAEGAGAEEREVLARLLYKAGAGAAADREDEPL